MQIESKQRALIIGAGSFGTAIAMHLARVGCHVYLWTRDEECAASINKLKKNNKYLKDQMLPDNITAFSDPLESKTISSFNLILWAVPTQSLREVCKRFDFLGSKSNVQVSLSKGFEVGTGKLPTEILSDFFTATSLLALSGPSFAVEIAHGEPTGVALAGKNQGSLREAQNILHTPSFRVYNHSDIVGLEIAGALKNVMAIASGVCAGIGYGQNAQATLITRALAEIVRVGCSRGAEAITFNGLGGVGDLFLTCTSKRSRNYTTGFRLGRGESLETIISSLGSVAEGVSTSSAAYNMCKNTQIRTPIINTVYKVLWESFSIKDAIYDLTHSKSHHEFEGY